MRVEVVHPLDHGKLRDLAERLCDISAGRLLTREGLEHRVAILMMCLRDDCRTDGAEEVLGRILARADDRLGRAGMSDVILEEIGAAYA
jgi:hypothetical protein